MANDILLDENNDLMIFEGDFVVGDSEMQEVSLILMISQGELKSDPLIGANLNTHIRGVHNPQKLQRHISTQLEMDDKDYDEIKDRIKTTIV